MMKMARSGYVAWLCLTLAMAAPAAEDTASRGLRIEDIYNLESLSDVQVAPDGRSIAYLGAHSDRDADEVRSTLWQVSYEGDRPLPLVTAADLDKPRFSPDGRYSGI